MKTLLSVLLVLFLWPFSSCAKAAFPNDAQLPRIEPPQVTQPQGPAPGPAGTIRPPVSTPPPAEPTRVDPLVPALADMKYLWAVDELGYYGVATDFAPSHMTAEEAINKGKAWFATHEEASKGVDVNSLQAMLVRFNADPKFPEFDRLSWFIVAPPDLGLQFQGQPPLVATRDTPVLYFWSDDFALLMDDETGDVWGGTTKMHISHIAPRLTIKQFEVVQKYADSYGWWAAWYRLREYNGGLMPQPVIDDLHP